MAMDKKERYSRQIKLKEIGKYGQKKLLSSYVLIIGAGGLGNIISNMLTRAGVGKIKIVDRDFVEVHNLQRQSLFEENDIGKAKALVAAEKLRKINNDVKIDSLVENVNSGTIENVIKSVNLIIDATDNLETRFLINDACVKHKIPWIYGGAIGTQGMCMNIIPNKTPCFRCIFPQLPTEPQPTCEVIGILNTIPVIIGSIEVTEALKILTGNYKTINKNILFYDVWHQNFKIIKIHKNSNCKCCVKCEFEFLKANL